MTVPSFCFPAYLFRYSNPFFQRRKELFCKNFTFFQNKDQRVENQPQNTGQQTEKPLPQKGNRPVQGQPPQDGAQQRPD